MACRMAERLVPGAGGLPEGPSPGPCSAEVNRSILVWVWEPDVFGRRSLPISDLSLGPHRPFAGKGGRVGPSAGSGSPGSERRSQGRAWVSDLASWRRGASGQTEASPIARLWYLKDLVPSSSGPLQLQRTPHEGPSVCTGSRGCGVVERASRRPRGPHDRALREEQSRKAEEFPGPRYSGEKSQGHWRRASARAPGTVVLR